MKIETPQEDKIIVELTDADMTELDITYEKMDYSNIETRRVIWTILDRARHTLGRDIDPSGRMLIEAMPKSSGGCVICFTVLGTDVKSASFRNMVKIRRETPTVTYEFENLEALISCAEKVKKTFGTVESSLYTLDGRYRLCISDGKSGVKNLISEYGTSLFFDSVRYEAMCEHGKLLADGNAVEMLTIGL